MIGARTSVRMFWIALYHGSKLLVGELIEFRVNESASVQSGGRRVSGGG